MLEGHGRRPARKTNSEAAELLKLSFGYCPLDVSVAAEQHPKGTSWLSLWKILRPSEQNPNAHLPDSPFKMKLFRTTAAED